MSQFAIQESEQFLNDVEVIAYWILESNLAQSEEMAVRLVDRFQKEIEDLKEKLKDFPELGSADSIKGVRKFPIYEGRYSVKWVVQKASLLVTLISISDSMYPKALRNVVIEDL